MQEFIEHWLFDPVVGKLIGAAMVVIIVVIIVRLLQKSVVRYVKDNDTRYYARKFITFVGYIAAFMALATIFSDKLGGLTIAFGVAGAGIAFALQEVIASVAGWAAVVFGHFYKTGDRVQLGGTRGDVIDVGVLRTTLMECGQWVNGDLYNGRVVRIANSFVFKEPVFNYSGDFPFLWDEIVVPIKHGSDFQAARKLFDDIAHEITADYARDANEIWKKITKKYVIEDARVEPMVTMAANENWMEYTIRYVVDYKKRRTTKDLFYSRILEALEKSAGTIDLAYATLAITESPQLDVSIKNQI